MASQESFEARQQRFSNGNDLVQSWGDYAAANTLVTKAALALFVPDTLSKNADVSSTLLSLNNDRNTRLPLVFKIKETNPDCMESRINRIAGYLKGEIGATSPSYKKIKQVLAKIKPQYGKKVPGTPRGAGKSPSERSFAAITGQADIVIATITALGVAYTPPDVNINVVKMTALNTQIRSLNSNIALKAEPYGNAVRARDKVFNDPQTGMNKRISIIKAYLSSFAGGRQSNHYIEFTQAIVGT